MSGNCTNMFCTAGKLYKTTGHSTDAADWAPTENGDKVLMFYQLDVPVGTVVMCVKSGYVQSSARRPESAALFLYEENVVCLEVFNNLEYPLEEISVSS